MPGMDVSYGGAFLAGLLSFLSPCVLPLVPSYLCFLAGAGLDRLTEEGGMDKALARRVFLSSLAFVFGFGTVFVSLGAAATALGQFVIDNLDILRWIAGILIIGFGLHYMGVFRISFLDYEKRFHVESKPSGFLGAYGLGLAFAFGWTPCVGPILASILMIAAGAGGPAAADGGASVGYGIALLSVYAAGIGIPFLVASLAVQPFMKFMMRFRRHLRKVEITIGLLLVGTGILIITGGMSLIGNWLLENVSLFQQIG